MFEQFITRLLGMERFSVSNRLEKAAPSVIVKKDSTEPIPEKYKKDVASFFINRTLYQPNSQRSPGNNAQEQKESRCL